MPGRPRKITLYKVKNKYFLKYYDSQGIRRNKAAGTDQEHSANIIKREIELLQINPKAEVSTKAKELYFTDNEGHKPLKPTKDIFQDLASHQALVSDLTKEVERLRDIESKYIALRNSIEGKLAEASKNAPTIYEALEKYEQSINHLARYKRNYYNYINEFFKNYIGWKITEISSEMIYNYLAKTCNTPERWNRQRKQFTKFFNWACGLWVFHNPMEQIQTKREREKEDPHFHTQKEIDKLLRKQPDQYHKALLSVLFYAGVSAHEFRGLEYKDYFTMNKQKFIRVAPNECRNIKAAKRRRNIPVGSKLAKALDNYLKVHNGGIALFPPIIHGCKGPFWNEGTLSRYLNEKVFPAGMDCKSTRRTYGSLQLRDGKTFAEVAALMGNSINMVEKHYARLKSSEINSNL